MNDTAATTLAIQDGGIFPLAAGGSKNFILPAMSPAGILEFVKVSGDTNEHHRSHDAAQAWLDWLRLSDISLPADETIVSGGRVLSMCEVAIIDWLGPGTTILDVSYKFSSPLISSHPALLRATVASLKPRPKRYVVELELRVIDAASRRLVTTAKVLLAVPRQRLWPA